MRDLIALVLIVSLVLCLTPAIALAQCSGGSCKRPSIGSKFSGKLFSGKVRGKIKARRGR